MPVAAVPGVDHQLGGGRLDGIGVLQLGIADEFVPEGEDQVGDAFTGASAQLQPALFGHRLLAVRPGGLRQQFEDGLGLFGRKLGVGLDRSGAGDPCGVVAGHAYESKGRAAQSGGTGKGGRMRSGKAKQRVSTGQRETRM